MDQEIVKLTEIFDVDTADDYFHREFGSKTIDQLLHSYTHGDIIREAIDDIKFNEYLAWLSELPPHIKEKIARYESGYDFWLDMKEKGLI